MLYMNVHTHYVHESNAKPVEWKKETEREKDRTHVAESVNAREKERQCARASI